MDLITGTAALETGDPIDFETLRRDRLQRILQGMEQHKLSVLILSKPENVRYVSGARALWTAGRRPFSPAAVVLGNSGEVHLMTQSDYLVPREIPRNRLFPPSWNPVEIMEHVTRIIGGAYRGPVGVDQMSQGFQQMLSAAIPSAQLSDGSRIMQEARLIKTPEEAACMSTAAAIAEAALVDVVDDLKPDVEESALLGCFERGVTRQGSTVTTVQGGFCVQPLECSGAEIPFRSMVRGRPVRKQDLLTLSGGVIYNGYAGEVGRTVVCGAVPSPEQQALMSRVQDARDAMLEVCRPGRTMNDLLHAHEKVAPLPMVPIAYGIGMGMEWPIAVSDGLPGMVERQILQPGMTLVIQPYVWQAGVGGALIKEMVLLSESGYDMVTSLPSTFLS